jgi:hypothetical protein
MSRSNCPEFRAFLRLAIAGLRITAIVLPAGAQSREMITTKI